MLARCRRGVIEMSKPPSGLGAGGRSLWTSIDGGHDLNAVQLVQMAEACRAKDRCADLAARLDEAYDPARLLDATGSDTLMKHPLAALRLRDEVTGTEPQFRGPRGAQMPTVPGGVSSLGRARAAKSGALVVGFVPLFDGHVFSPGYTV